MVLRNQMVGKLRKGRYHWGEEILEGVRNKTQLSPCRKICIYRSVQQRRCGLVQEYVSRRTRSAAEGAYGDDKSLLVEELTVKKLKLSSKADPRMESQWLAFLGLRSSALSPSSSRKRRVVT